MRTACPRYGDHVGTASGSRVGIQRIAENTAKVAELCWGEMMSLRRVGIDDLQPGAEVVCWRIILVELVDPRSEK